MDKLSDHQHDGLVLHFFISTSKFNGDELMNKLKAHNLGHLAKQIAKAWNLDLEQLSLYDLEETDFSGDSKAIISHNTDTQFMGRVHTQRALELDFMDNDGSKEEGQSAEIIYDEGTKTGSTNSTNQDVEMGKVQQAVVLPNETAGDSETPGGGQPIRVDSNSTVAAHGDATSSVNLPT